MTVSDDPAKTRADIVLAAIVAGGKDAQYNAVQLQQLLFLANRECSLASEASLFSFEPGQWGPYSKVLEDVLDTLAVECLLHVDWTGGYWTLAATESGQARGEAGLAQMDRPAAKRLRKVARWVLARTFWEVITEVASRYPEMTTDDQVPRLARGEARRTGRRMHPFLAGMAKVFGTWEPRSELPPQERDAAAIKSDWRAVGEDLRFAMDQVLPPEGAQSDNDRSEGGNTAHAEDDSGALPDPRSAPVPRAERQTVALEYARTIEFLGGVLPPPEVLGRYGKLQPDAVERIFSVAEHRAAQRRAQELATTRISLRGQAVGFTIAFISILSGLVLIAVDKPLLGVAVMIGYVATLTGLVVWAKATPSGWPRFGKRSTPEKASHRSLRGVA